MSEVAEPVVVKSPVSAEATLTPDTDEAAVFADIAGVALAQTKRPLAVALVERWPQPGGATIVRVTFGEDSEGTAARLWRWVGGSPRGSRSKIDKDGLGLRLLDIK